MTSQVLFFDSLGALEAHLQTLLGSCKESSDKCKETLGNLLREKQSNKEEEQWSQEISKALFANPEAGEKKLKEKEPSREKPKKERPRMFGGSKAKAPSDWVSFDPFSVFVGQESKGMAELYFEAINALDDTAKKIELALTTLGTLKGKAAAAGNVSVLVSFINSIPVKIILKPAQEENAEKKRLEFSFKVPVARQVIPHRTPL